MIHRERNHRSNLWLPRQIILKKTAVWLPAPSETTRFGGATVRSAGLLRGRLPEGPRASKGPMLPFPGAD